MSTETTRGRNVRPVTRKGSLMATTSTLSILASDAEIAGHKAGLAVLAGKLAVEDAGTQWVKWADRSYGQGRAFERGYEAAGAQR